MKIFNSYLLVTKNDPQETLNWLLKEANIKVHPADLVLVEPEGLSISISQVRDLKRIIFQKPIVSTYKIVAITHAHLLTTEAQNSLLKVLEEPPESTILVLITPTKTKLLPTILSRTVSKIVPNTSKAGQEDACKQISFSEISDLKDPKTYIDKEIKVNFEELIQSLDDKEKRSALTYNIEIGKETKKMLDANVHGKFALAGYLMKKK